MKPIITIIKDAHCIIIEVMSSESSIKCLEQKAREKTTKYKSLLKELSQVNSNSGEIISH